MRSNEERIAEVKRRIEKREREERLHRSRITGFCAVAASLVLIICLSFFMPDAASRNRNNSYSNYDMAASIFGNSEALGYIAIGLLAFLLGICVTILCFRIRLLDGQSQDTEDKKGDREDGADQ